MRIGKPQGLLDGSAAIPVVTAAVGNSTSFSWDSIVDLIFALPMQYRAGACFIGSDGIAKALIKVKGSTSGDPIMALGNPPKLMGYDFFFSADMPTNTASAKPLIFVNLAQCYAIRRVNELGVLRQDELLSNTGMVGFRAFARVDGKVVLPAAGVIAQLSAT